MPQLPQLDNTLQCIPLHHQSFVYIMELSMEVMKGERIRRRLLFKVTFELRNVMGVQCTQFTKWWNTLRFVQNKLAQPINKSSTFSQCHCWSFAWFFWLMRKWYVVQTSCRYHGQWVWFWPSSPYRIIGAWDPYYWKMFCKIVILLTSYWSHENRIAHQYIYAAVFVWFQVRQ